jgi:hypothetical protein
LGAITILEEGKANLPAPEILKTTASHRPNAEKLDFAVALSSGQN